MSEYTDKLQEWVDSVKMCEAAGIDPCYKLNGRMFHDNLPLKLAKERPNIFTFPIAAVEGKPVFVGDELYSEQGCCFIVNDVAELVNCSWNPPKPATVMVEMPFNYVELHAAVKGDTILLNACRKALEKA